jgi:hypothetical protein
MLIPLFIKKLFEFFMSLSASKGIFKRIKLKLKLKIKLNLKIKLKRLSEFLHFFYFATDRTHNSYLNRVQCKSRLLFKKAGMISKVGTYKDRLLIMYESILKNMDYIKNIMKRIDNYFMKTLIIFLKALLLILIV